MQSSINIIILHDFCMCIQSRKSLFCKKEKVKYVKTNHPATAKAMAEKPLTGYFAWVIFF